MAPRRDWEDMPGSRRGLGRGPGVGQNLALQGDLERFLWVPWLHPQQPAVLPFVGTAKSQVLILVHKTPHGPGSHRSSDLISSHFLSPSPVSLILLFKNGNTVHFLDTCIFSPFSLWHPHTRRLHSSFLHSMWLCAECYQRGLLWSLFL